MNFFESQAQARTSSRRFVLLFIVAVVLIVAAIDFVVLFAFMAAEAQGDEVQFSFSRQYTHIVVVTSILTLGVILIASLVRTAQLRGGGGVVARGAGGTLISPDTMNPRYRRLRNVVEEIAIASGVPAPEIYVLEQEPGINAFAAGYTPANAAVAVTRGAMEKLNRDELQGVIAHEFSHILNGDMRLNIRLMGLLFGILVLHIVGREVLNIVGRGRRSGGSKKGDPTAAIVLVALAIMILGWLGVIMGRLIKAAVARHRESLADAAAVQFTRQTKGIAGALKKIAGIDEGSKLKGNAEEVSHMLFGEGSSFSGLFATHPPIEQRIKVLEPSFNLRQIESLRQTWNSPSFTVEDDVGSVMQSFDAGARLEVADGALRVGSPAAADFERAEALHQSLPEDLLSAARGEQASALLMALLVQMDGQTAGRQMAAIESGYGAAAGELVRQLGARIQALRPAQRLPLASIALPALRQWPRDRLLKLMQTITFLIQADGQVAVFEYRLSRLLRDQLEEVLHPQAARAFGNKSLPQCSRSVQVLLTILAQQGHGEGSAARAAYLAGMQIVLPREALPFQPIEAWPAALDAALTDLDELKPRATGPLIDALLAVMNHDGRVTVAEAELLRVICATLHCPLPPLLGAAAA